MSKKHKDVEFHVGFEEGDHGARVFDKFDEACARAVSSAASGKPCLIDVIFSSKAGARSWGGGASRRAERGATSLPP